MVVFPLKNTERIITVEIFVRKYQQAASDKKKSPTILYLLVISKQFFS